MKLVGSIALATGLLASAVQVVATRPAMGAGPDSFTGTCQSVGTVDHSPPLGSLLTPTTISVSTMGSCFGRLSQPGRRAQLIRAPMSYTATGGGLLSCLTGSTSGNATLQFAGDAFPMTFSEVRFPGGGVVSFAGLYGGRAEELGLAQPSTTYVQACATNSLSSVPTQLFLSSVSLRAAPR